MKNLAVSVLLGVSAALVAGCSNQPLGNSKISSASSSSGKISDDLYGLMPSNSTDMEITDQRSGQNVIFIKGAAIAHNLYGTDLYLEVSVKNLSKEKELYLVLDRDGSAPSKVRYTTRDEWSIGSPDPKAIYIGPAPQSLGYDRFMIKITRAGFSTPAKASVDLYVKMNGQQYEALKTELTEAAK